MRLFLYKKGSGYYTVEATFIVTICIVVLMAILYTGLYVHDRIIVETVTSKDASFWIHQDEDDKWSEEEFADEVKNDLLRKLFLFRVHHVGVDELLIMKTITVSYDVPVSLGFLKRIWSGRDGFREENIHITEVRPAKWKWDADAIKELKTSKEK